MYQRKKKAASKKFVVRKLLLCYVDQRSRKQARSTEQKELANRS